MPVTVELVGGIHDGDIREMPDAREEWRFPRHEISFRAFASASDILYPEPADPLIYRRDGAKLMRDRATHEIIRVLVYRLVNP